MSIWKYNMWKFDPCAACGENYYIVNTHEYDNFVTACMSNPRVKRYYVNFIYSTDYSDIVFVISAYDDYGNELAKESFLMKNRASDKISLSEYIM